MKRKFLISIMAVTLGVMFLMLSACSCSCGGAATLSFTSAWNTANKQIGYKETSVYKVEHDTKFVTGSYDYSMSDEAATQLENELLKFDDGTCTITLEVLPKNKLAEATGFTSDILDENVTQIIHMTSDFAITSHYMYKEGDEEASFKAYNDSIKMDVYFVDDSSFAPLYAVQESKYAYLHTDTGINEVHFKNEFLYSKTKYTINAYNMETDEVNASRDYNYTYKSAVDNTQLLFLLRNLSLSGDTTAVGVPTVSATYGRPETLSMGRFDSATENFDITVNSTSLTQTPIEISKLAFQMSNANRGRAQLAYVQAKANDSVANNALLLKYVEPLTTYGSFLNIGVLVYSLQSVTYSSAI